MIENIRKEEKTKYAAVTICDLITHENIDFYPTSKKEGVMSAY